MKRLSRKRKLRLLLLQRKQEHRLLRLRMHQLRIRRRRRGTPRRARETIYIQAPQTFSLEIDAERGPLLAFLAQLRFAYRHHYNKTVVIDFSRTSRLVAHGTLLFYAELKRLLEYRGHRLRLRCTLAANSRANQVLKQIGVFDLCRQTAEIKTTRADVVHWRVAQGHIVDNFICAPAIEAYEGKIAEPLLDGIFRGLGEAMTNAKHHAYIAIRQDDLNISPERQDWWMFSQARDGFLSVVFCDLGVGIPATLSQTRPDLFAYLQKKGLAETDSACIEQAIEDSRTRTRVQGRGWGLGNIVNVVTTVRGGLVLVMSNRGFFVVKDGVTTKSDFKGSILGTLIYWRVPLGGSHAT